jgi:hypothetical protein
MLFARNFDNVIDIAIKRHSNCLIAEVTVMPKGKRGWITADDAITNGQAKRLRNLGPERSAADSSDKNGNHGGNSTPWSLALGRRSERRRCASNFEAGVLSAVAIEAF